MVLQNMLRTRVKNIYYIISLAFKTMQIYIAPKILIFNLKRFKDSHKLFKSKLETNVDFPLNGLDMSDFLSDTRLPDEALNNT